ncbi:MAG: hypothetical protein JNG90_06715 [Planctomycetaceae bacterium]|nr:hypothetical protein [Planctomycetaceae bacterium]
MTGSIIQANRASGRPWCGGFGIALAALILAAMGCERAKSPGPQPIASGDKASQPADAAPPQATPAKATPAATGWPAGDDPAASLESLRAKIEATFNGLKFVEPLIYPAGWTQRRYPAQKVTVEVAAADAEGRPTKGLVKLTYQKLNSMIHPTQEAADADTELLPYPAAESREEMTGYKVNRRWPPTEAEITYELKDGRWVRTAYQTKIAGREGSDWLDQIGIP